MLIVRRSKLYYTVSGIITPIGGRPVHRLREDCCILRCLVCIVVSCLVCIVVVVLCIVVILCVFAVLCVHCCFLL